MILTSYFLNFFSNRKERLKSFSIIVKATSSSRRTSDNVPRPPPISRIALGVGCKLFMDSSIIERICGSTQKF